MPSKTRLAVAAVRVALARGGVALVLVATLDLQRQWDGQLRAQVPGVAWANSEVERPHYMLSVT